jgi:nitroimidazol reductase NimA-like FMN-containing flavoprotein (pyridoxamine 5'-phosphate oxidase superfamily)
MIAALTDKQIEEILYQNVLGHLGCNDGFNTYVFPINYVYDGKYIICHSQTGLKIEAMRQNKRVCLQVDEIKDFKNWKSILVLGDFQELEEERERYQAIKVFVDRHLQLKINHPLGMHGKAEQNEGLNIHSELRPIIYRILIDEKNGRFETD